MINTRVDNELKNLMNCIVEKSKLEASDIYKIIDVYREKFNVDLVYVCEALTDSYGFNFEFLSYDNPLYDFMNETTYMTEEVYNNILSIYDENCLSEVGLYTFPKDFPLKIIHYGIISNNIVAGCVGMIVCDEEKVWSDEEKLAMQYLGRLLRGFIQEERLKRIDYVQQLKLVEAYSKEKQYHDAITEGADCVIEANLTQDKLISAYIKIDGNLVDVTNEQDYLCPKKYSEFILSITKRMCKTDSEDFLEISQREQLIQKFEKGEKEQFQEYMVKDTEGKKIYMRATYILTKNQITQDIFALTIVKDETERKHQEEERIRLLEMIEGLSIDYPNVFYMNFDTRVARIYRSSEKINKHYGGLLQKELDYEKFVTFYVEGAVIPEEREEFIKTFEENNIRKLVQETGSYIYNYIINRDGVFEYQQLKVAKGDKEGKVLVFAFKDMDKVIEEERKQQQVLREHLEVINGLATEYTCVFLVDVKTSKVKIYKDAEAVSIKNGILREGETFKNLIIKYMDRYIAEEEKYKYRKYENLENLYNRLLEEKDLKVDFKKIVDNEEEYSQIRFTLVKDKDGNDVVVAAIRSINDIVREQERELSENLRREKMYKETLKQALDQAENANKAKSIFLNNMSHDIRTPMNAILGFTGIAKKYLDDKEKTLEYLDKIELSSQHLLSLINDVLDMSRIESGKVIIDESAASITKVTQNVIDIFQQEAEKKHIDFNVEFADLINDYVYLDVLRINQIALNLLSNAFKYTKDGGKINYIIRQLPTSKKDIAEFEFIYQDTGIGMSSQFVSQIFEAFSRENNSTVSGIQGTGLGMAITKSLVELMGGTIYVKSILGKGTVITVNISFRIANEQNKTEIINEEHYNFEGKKLLLVEDNELNREIAIEILKDMRCEVFTAEDGSVAYEKMQNAKEGDYDLILMDIQMPYMDGYTATRLIRRLQDKKVAKIPIIAMTANAFAEDRQKALRVGMNEHIAKPIDVNKLVECMNKIFVTK